MSAESGNALNESNEVEHEHIHVALDVEDLDTNLFRSKSLWLPLRARGAFGGQVISQALVSATRTVDAKYGLHSLHCYFLTSAATSVPIIYSVDRVRQGRSYANRAVRAIQNGRVVFILICSFSLPEPWQPQYQWKMPDVPPPEDLELEEERFKKLVDSGKLHQRAKEFFEDFASERKRSPIAIKSVRQNEPQPDGSSQFVYYFKAKSIPKYPVPFQKCILSYMSDLYFLGAVPNTMQLKRFSKGEKSTGMTSSLDHSIHFYSDDFDCGDWMLYVMSCSRAGSGRGIVHGQLYTREGTLVAVLQQEGVVRAAIRGPIDAKL